MTEITREERVGEIQLYIKQKGIKIKKGDVLTMTENDERLFLEMMQQSIEATGPKKALEKMIIGICLHVPGGYQKAYKLIEDADFSCGDSLEIWQAIWSLHKSGIPPDKNMVLVELKRLRPKYNDSFFNQALDKGAEMCKPGAHLNFTQMCLKLKEMSVEMKARNIIEEMFILTRSARKGDVFDWADKFKAKFDEATKIQISEVKDIRKEVYKVFDDYHFNKDNKVSPGVRVGLERIDYRTGGFKKGNLILLAGRPGAGKCLSKGTKIIMYDGSLKNVEDVVVGDKLMGDDSTPRNVLSLARGREMMYWIRQNKAIDYRVNESHILSLKASGTDGSRIHGSVVNISVKDFIQKSKKYQVRHKGYKTPVDFPEKELPLDPYFIGLWLGDGTAKKPDITNPEPEIKNYLQGFAKSIGLIYREYKAEGKCETLIITSGIGGSTKRFSLYGQLRKLNLIGNKHIPNDYLINSRENRLKLLAGLVDTDGYYSQGYFEITQKNKDLALQIKFLADSLGFRTTFSKKIASIKSIGFKGEYWKVNISGNISEVPTIIPRKKAPASSNQKDPLVTGITVEKDCVDDYYGFEIDGNRLFLLEDMTVTHNTAGLVAVTRGLMKRKIKTGIFSLEMTTAELVQRIASPESQVDLGAIVAGKLTAEEETRYLGYLEKFQSGCIFITDEFQDISHIEAKAEVMVNEQGCEILLVDYIQLVRNKAKTGSTKNDAIGDVSTRLKALAKRLDVPIVALAQVGRIAKKQVIDAKSKVDQMIPTLEDLKDSGNLEADADMVLFVFRPYYYKNEFKLDAWYESIIRIVCAKYRNGAIFDEKLQWIPKYAEIKDTDFVPETVREHNQQFDNNNNGEIIPTPF